MKIYDLTLEQNRLVSAIINDITKDYKAHAFTKQYERWANEGIDKVRARAKARGLLLDEADFDIPVKNIVAIVRGSHD